jgi:uncharacterized membrane protein
MLKIPSAEKIEKRYEDNENALTRVMQDMTKFAQSVQFLLKLQKSRSTDVLRN